jgi:hypothetical protein
VKQEKAMNTNYARISRNDDEPVDDEADWIAERAAELAQTEAIRKEADEWLDGTFDGEHYSEVERALADLHEVEPSDLLGSSVLERLYRLAKVHGEARKAKALELANDKAQREWDDRQTGPEEVE